MSKGAGNGVQWNAQHDRRNYFRETDVALRQPVMKTTEAPEQ